MRGTRTVLASGFFALVLISGSSARSAADDCLEKPNGPTPQGQHWYYRIDHANNGRQCWYLRESDRIQRTSRQTEPNSSNAMAQAMPAPRQPTGPAAETPLGKNTAPTTAPIPWLNVQKLPEPIPLVQPVTQQKPAAQTQSDGGAAAATSGSAVAERVIDPPAVANRPAASTDSNAASAQRAKELQRRQFAEARTEPPVPAIAHIDHTFALLMIMFVALAIAGPALHFVERRRRRKAVNFRRPPRPRVVALNAPAPRVGLMPRPRVAKPPAPAPMPIRPPDQTERLAHALQQLVDRLQTADRHEPKTVRARPLGRTSM